MPRAVDRKTVRSRSEELDGHIERVDPRFACSEVRERARDRLCGLLSGAERKYGWRVAEVAGDATPYGLQHLLGRAHWNAEQVRYDLRGYVLEHLGDDESCYHRRDKLRQEGPRERRGQRQYTGTAGRTNNC